MKYDYDANVKYFTDYMEKEFKFSGKKILDIGCGDGNMVKRISELYDPKQIIGVDIHLRVDDQESEKCKLMGNVNAWELPFDDNTFDFVYSVSTFEHIGDIVGTLSEIKRVLKPKAKFFTSFSPLWTSVAGHHVYCVKNAMREGCDRDEEVVDAIPAWGHLYMSEEEMFEHLSKTDISMERIKAILFYIYHHNDINRHTASETRGDFINSGMIIRKYSERVAFSREWALDKKGESELTEEIKSRIKQSQYKLSDIGIVGMSAQLEKYESF